MRVSGLRARLLLLLGVAVLPAVVLLLLGRAAERRATVRELNTQAMNLARLTAQAHGQRIEQARQLLIAIATHPVVQGTDTAACNELVEQLADQYAGIYATIGRARADSGVVDCLALQDAPAGMPSPIGTPIDDRDYFQRAKKENRFVVGDFMQGKIRRQPILAFALPLRQDGTLSHILFANFDLVLMSRSLEDATRLEGATVSLLDRNGALIARSSEAEKYFGFTPSNEQLRLMRERTEVLSTFSGPDDVRRVFAIVQIRDRDDTLLGFATVGIPESNPASVLDPIGGEWVTIGVLALGLFLVVWGGSELLIRRPVAKLVAATGRLASGELDVRAGNVGGVRELQTLAIALNQMAGKLQERELHLRGGQRLEAVGQLAGGIAHDFNNLLTVIIGYADSLGESLPAGSIEARQLSELRAAGERAGQLTQQLLGFSRRQVLQPTPLQLNEVVGDMVSLLRRTTGGNILIHLELEPDLGLVYADRVQMEQVILNLVINARDAMPSGGQLTIATRNETADAGCVELSVTDSGKGMDAATRSRIFEPFFTTKGAQGTGLGLATVYGIVKQSDGDISCDSEIGKGTTFRVRLPRYGGVANAAEDERPPLPVGGSESVLLVDDDDAVRSLLELVLQRGGYQVRSTGEPRMALRWFADGYRPDIVVTDVRMPEMNGTVLARALKDYNPSLKVILISGDAAPTLAGQDHIEGATFEQKPITPPMLLRAIRARLDE